MSAHPQIAMVMAAGLGTRMRPLTDDTCKALVELNGKTLIDWTLDKLAKASVQRTVVNVHHFADALETHLSARTRPPEIIISDERDLLLETGGGLAKAAPLLGKAPIYVANIDAVWIDKEHAELDKLGNRFDPETMDFLLLLAPMAQTLGFDGAGDFFLEKDGRLTRRGDRPSAPYAYAGVQIINPGILETAPIKPFSTNLLWNKALAEGRIYGCVMDAFWMHVGDPKARQDAENRLRS